ncbi:DJ-1/PfpI family protein [Chromohalobacter nigrandesensis]|uniref:DJ-1/PfpI family protein n=1 Tax=Chromohalobacter nigrandesensis TaxID=119863 RepID=UPI001FF0F3BC|nr:DJ-1/PfpI family protein [Chromohalobacter nigrandesensis]MCK0746824.1 DJ-1/PfpI family protein [Chromohalobacter nigrandesensis]
MKKQDVHVLVFDSMSDWEAAYATSGINNPQFQRVPDRYQVRTVSVSGAPVVTAGGLRIQPDMALVDLAPSNSAMFIMPGGALWDEGGNIEAVEVAQHFLDAGKPVAAICGATAGLARGGLLDTRRHTSNALEYLSATGYGGIDLFEDKPAVTDGGVVTASAMSPVDFAYHIFALLGLYEPPVLDAWYGLFKTGRAEYFGELMDAANA